MAQVQQRVLTVVGLMAAASLVADSDVRGPKFYDDDPLLKMPRPMDAGSLKSRKLSDMYDFFFMTFGKPGEKQKPGAIIPAKGVNTLGEVPDSAWYTNRHTERRMSIEELVRGPGNTNSPAMDKPWQVIAAKTEGVTPGFTIRDSKGRRYQMKFDTPGTFELTTGADVMGTKFFYALGYYTPENYIVYFTPEQLTVDESTTFVDYRGVQRPMRQSDIAGVLARLPVDSKGRLRALASFYLEGKPLGPFRYHSTRTDDPNDIVPHEHRRDLRGLRVFCAWLNHSDSKALNSLDTLVKDGGIQYVRHNLIDFGAAFGAEAFEPKSPRSGYVPMFDWSSSATSFLTLGLYVPPYARAHHPFVAEVGRLESEVFDPEQWVGNYYNPAFANMLPDDAFWAAKQVMAFTEPEVRAIVQTGEYSSAEGAEYLIHSLMQRREKIGRAFFAKVLPLDNFRVEDGRLEFDDLAVKYGFRQPLAYGYEWAPYDNAGGVRGRILNGLSNRVPPMDENTYVTVRIEGEDALKSIRKSMDVYLHRKDGRTRIVGVERRW